MKNRLLVGALCALLLITSKTKSSYETVGPYMPYAAVLAILFSEGLLNLPIDAVNCWNEENKSFQDKSFMTKLGWSTTYALGSIFTFVELLPRTRFLLNENIFKTIGDSRKLSIASFWICAGLFFTHFMARSLHAGGELHAKYKNATRTEHHVTNKNSSNKKE